MLARPSALPFQIVKLFRSSTLENPYTFSAKIESNTHIHRPSRGEFENLPGEYTIVEDFPYTYLTQKGITSQASRYLCGI